MENGEACENRSDALYQNAESKANRHSLRYLLALAGVLLLCELLNEIGLFQVAPFVMRVGAICGILCYMTPVVCLCRPLRLLGKNCDHGENRPWYKYFIIAFTWLGTTATCVTLTHHTVLVMAIPIIMMAQYRDTVKLVPITFVLATFCVFLGVYGGFFWGCFDGNLLHLGITESNAFDLAMRGEIATRKRMTELLTHYVLPRELIVVSLIFLAARISHRNDEMLGQQARLQSAVEQEMRRTNEIQWQIIDGMANLIENRDANTGEHVKRTSFYVKEIVCKMQENPFYKEALSDEYAKTIVKAAPLHDIGKIVVADRILQKPGKLTPEEYEQIKLHASQGSKVIENVLGNVEDPRFLHVAKEISDAHHERWDGKGYPNGLNGNSIPLSARIMAVADVFDALVSRRVYKAPIPPEEAFAIIESEAGKQFDSGVVKAFCAIKPQIMAYLSDAPVVGAKNG